MAVTAWIARIGSFCTSTVQGALRQGGVDQMGVVIITFEGRYFERSSVESHGVVIA